MLQINQFNSNLTLILFIQIILNRQNFNLLILSMNTRITVSQIYNIQSPTLVTSNYCISNVFFTDHFIYLIDKHYNKQLKKISLKNFQLVQSINLPKFVYQNQISSLTQVHNVIVFSLRDSNNVFYFDFQRQCNEAVSHMSQINQLINYKNRIATCSNDLTIRIWDIQNQSKLVQSNKKHIYSGHSSKINCLQTYQNILISGSNDKNVIFWQNDQILCIFKSSSTVKSVLTCIQSDQFIVFSQNKQITVLSIKSIVKSKKPQILRAIKYESQNKFMAKSCFKLCQQIDDSFFIFIDDNMAVFVEINLGEIIKKKQLILNQNQNILDIRIIGRMILIASQEGNLSLLNY